LSYIPPFSKKETVCYGTCTVTACVSLGGATSIGTRTLYDHPNCSGMMQVEHILVAKELQDVTKKVVETARENLIIGPS